MDTSRQENNIDFPFKKNHHYRVIKEWYRNGTTFEVGQELMYEDLIYNHYDDVKIFCFKDVKRDTSFVGRVLHTN